MVPHEARKRQPFGPGPRVWPAMIGLVVQLIRLVLDLTRH